MYPQIGAEVFAEWLPRLFMNVEDQRYYRTVFYLASVSDAWEYVGSAARIKVINYVAQAPVDSLGKFLHHAVAVPELRVEAEKRVPAVDVDTLGKLITASPSLAYVDEALSRFESARSFRGAENLCELLVVPLATFLRADDIQRIVAAFEQNGQITYAGGIPNLLVKVFEDTAAIRSASRSHWKKLLKKLTADELNIPNGGRLRDALSHYMRV
jgi:hypothetical protein